MNLQLHSSFASGKSTFSLKTLRALSILYPHMMKSISTFAVSTLARRYEPFSRRTLCALLPWMSD